MKIGDMHRWLKGGRTRTLQFARAGPTAPHPMMGENFVNVHSEGAHAPVVPLGRNGGLAHASERAMQPCVTAELDTHLAPSGLAIPPILKFARRAQEPNITRLELECGIVAPSMVGAGGP